MTDLAQALAYAFSRHQAGAPAEAEPIPSLELFDSARAWRMVAAAFVAMFAVAGFFISAKQPHAK